MGNNFNGPCLHKSLRRVKGIAAQTVLISPQGIDSAIPSVVGSYGLVCFIPRRITWTVGKLGCRIFPRGYYLYLGSAFGPGGLRARIHRHLRKEKKIHWHIDYLGPIGRLKAVWVVPGAVSQEHHWARCLLTRPAQGVAVKGFGCSDCRCVAHLFYFKNRPASELLTGPFGRPIVFHIKDRTPTHSNLVIDDTSVVMRRNG